ncbi:unnamed protein product [Cunninghamella blakesleeana]
MASVWYDKQQDKKLLEKVMKGLDFWFDNDYTNEDCTMSGGKSYKNCPCGTPGLWNMKWDSQVITIPRLIGNICLLVHKHLSHQQKESCIKFTSRSYYLAHQHRGSHLLEVVHNGISLALLENNTLILQDALDRACEDAFISPAGKDGIQIDGSYSYYAHQLYNGFYGEMYLINLLDIFDMMQDVEFWSPPDNVRQVFANLLIGSEWMMIGYRLKNSKYSSYIQSPLLWQYGSLGRMVSYKSDELQSTAGILLNLTQLEKITKSWPSLPVLDDPSSSITDTNKTYTLSTTVHRLQQPYSSANQGRLIGTKYFYNSEYLVHRCSGFVTTLKLVSNRTTTSECVDNQNKLGTYLNDGSIFTYQRGDEYLDIFGAWDWYKVPGTTVNKNESITCSEQHYYGKEPFVGAATLENKQMGVAVMNFTNPRSSIHNNDDFIGWQKSFFFFPSMYAVHIDMIPSTSPITNISSSSTVTANNQTDTNNNNYKNKNLYMTTLDQKRKNGDVLIDGKIVRNPNGVFDQVTSLWHDKILYTFDKPLQINLDTHLHQSDWSSIGVSKGNESISIFSATIDAYYNNNKNNDKKKGNKTSYEKENEPLLSWSYIVQPNFDIRRLQHDFVPPIEFIEMGQVKGAFSPADRALGLVFWAPESVEVPWDSESEDEDANFVYIETVDPLLVFLQQQGDGTWMLSVSDPTQTLVSTLVSISVDQEEIPIQYRIDLPQGQFLGSSVIKILEDEP